MDEAEIKSKALLVRPFLDFQDEEEQLKKVAKYEEQKEKGTLPELSEDFIIRTYKLSKLKEHAFNH